MSSQSYFSLLSPNDPSVQAAFSKALSRYFWNSAAFSALVVVAFIALTVLARQTDDPKLQKRLRLFRKVGTYIVVLGWVIFTGVTTGFIPTGL